MLGSGQDFSFGKDRPASRDKYQAVYGGQGSYITENVETKNQSRYMVIPGKKPEFGHIRSENSGKSGPSKREDRQYKPF